MAETKDDIAAERDALKAENEQLKARLAEASSAAAELAPARGYAPAQTFQLSEGDRQELIAHGVVNVGGVAMTRDDVRAKLGDDQQNVDLGTAEIDPATAAAMQQHRPQGAQPGVDFVYPSVAPGQIDPAVAGTPGISGPAADAK